MPLSYGVSGIPDDEVHAAITAAYGSDPVKLGLAESVAVIAGEFTRTVGASPERVKRREYRRKCRRYISDKAKETIPQPKTFIGTFFFLAVLSGIISYFVQMLMRKYFGEADAKTMAEEQQEDLPEFQDFD